MKTILLALSLSVSIFSFGQVNNIPYANKSFLKENATVFQSPEAGYSQTEANIDHREIKLLYKTRDGKIKGINDYYNGLKIVTEGYVDAISKIPFVSPFIAAGKEKLYQEAEKSIDLKTNAHKLDFDKKVEALFVADMQQILNTNGSISFDEAVESFGNTVQGFGDGLDKNDYQIVAPIVDVAMLSLITENRNYFEEKFEEQKIEAASTQTVNAATLQANIDEQVKAMKKSLVNYDKELLSKIQENANGLITFNNAVNKKFDQVQEDIKKMGSDIESNKAEIKSNTSRIKANTESITVLKQLQTKNGELISENSYKIDVISGVLYEQANTSGKMRLLNLKFKENLTNPSYLEKKQVLENIQAVEEINSYLSGAQEFVTLAGHLGVSPETLEKANKAIKLGEVITNGALAYFTGDPMAGLQAVNGALSLLGGGGNSNPEFDAIMAEFAQINAKLDLINKKLDLITENIYDLKKLNLDIFRENQKRFTHIDEKLADIQTGVNSITQLIYSDRSAALEMENASQWNHLWEEIRNTNSLDQLKKLYRENQVVKDLVGIVYTNTETKSSDKKTFLHFDGKDFDKYWQNEIFTPILDIHQGLNPTYAYENLEYPVVGIYEYDKLIRLEKDTLDKEIFPQLDYKDLPKLLHPQSVITLSEYLSLFEPYYYFYSSDDQSNFNITENVAELDFVAKNKHLKIQFQNVLKENRQAIIQTNLMSGITLLRYFTKHIVDRTMPVSDKKQVYKLLRSENNYLKLNLSNHIINTAINQKSMLIKFEELENASDTASARKIAEAINQSQSFENQAYKLVVVGNSTDFQSYILIKPYGENPDDFTNQKILLPIPSFEYLYENKTTYPEYLQALILNQEILMNKVIKYDIPLRIQDMPEYNNFQLLN
jgi:hypothetical protein